MIKLVSPNRKYIESYLSACKEFAELGIRDYFHDPQLFDLWKDSFVESFEDESKGIGLQEGWVSASTFWIVDGNEFIGRGQIRHKLTPQLEKFGGHIGYGIRFSKWNEGYGTKLLGLLLPEAKKLGISKALITCDDNNIGSIKIIENNGGILENKVEDVIDNKNRVTRRYWIQIK